MASQREKYRLIRYDYYHAGRCLQYMGNFHSAGIMLGYTIETIMKAALTEVMTADEQSKSAILKRSHDVEEIWDECGKHGIFKNVSVSRDFLRHINNNFQRYPSQMARVFEASVKEDIVLSNSQTDINYYDSLIVSLDKALLTLTSDVSSSVIYFAFRTIETRYAKDILHRNAFVLQHYDFYTGEVLKNLPERQDHRETIFQGFEKGVGYYWDENNQKSYNSESVEIIRNYSCDSFEFKKWGFH